MKFHSLFSRINKKHEMSIQGQWSTSSSGIGRHSSSLFSRIYKKHIINLLSAESAQGVVKVKLEHSGQAIQGIITL